MGLLHLQPPVSENNKLSRYIFFIKSLPQVVCYSDTKWYLQLPDRGGALELDNLMKLAYNLETGKEAIQH